LRKVKTSDIIGIGGLITEYTKIVNLTNYIKDNQPDIPIILGGPCTTTLFDKVLEKTKADYAVIGEGEISTVNLVKAIENNLSLKGVKGIVFRKNKKIIMTKPQPHIENLDELPSPSRHLLQMEKYIYDYLKTLGLSFDDFKKIRNTTIISSRGCPYHCTFCDKGIWGYKWRARSPQNLIDEISFLKEKYKINCVWFTDDTFVVNKKRVEEFSKMMERMDVIWNCYGRVNLMQDKDLFFKMRKGNCRVIGYGFESGDQCMLDNSIKKGTTLEQARKSVKFCKDSKIRVGGFFVLGMPGETKKSIEKTFSFARELDLDYYAFSVATAYPGTELYKTAIKNGKIQEDKYSLDGSDWIADVAANFTDNIGTEELRQYQNKAFLEFVIKKQFGKHYYLHPTFIKRALKIVTSIRNKEEASKLYKKIKKLIS
jgi:anaerobic magnesium-protoporphyrin IX monomethyl ester cyclase